MNKQEAAELWTNQQWKSYDSRGPAYALKAAGANVQASLGWVDHQDTFYLGKAGTARRWRYTAEPHSTIENVQQNYADQFEFLKTVGWEVRFAGKEESVWAALWDNDSIHISLTKAPEDQLVELEAWYDGKLDVLKEELKSYHGKYFIEGTDRTTTDIRADRDQIKTLRKLVRKS
jgi:hypothetical protein